MATKTKKKHKKRTTKTKYKKRTKSKTLTKKQNSKSIIFAGGLIGGLLILLLIIISIVVAANKSNTQQMSYSKLTITSSVAKGVDVSKYDGKIDWKKVAKDVDFAYIRIGYSGYFRGEMHTDKKAEYNMKNATKNGVPIGIYYYSQATTVKEAKAEANFALKHLKGYDIELPVFIDFEYASNNGKTCGRLYNAKLSKKEATDIINAFCQVVKDAGYTCGVYANTHFYESKFNPKDIDEDAVKWVADYNKEITYSGEYDVWQYTSEGKCNGINRSEVDLDYWYSKTQGK